MMEIRYCTKCVYPETKPDLTFNEEGVCSACIAAAEKHSGIDWAQRAIDFHEIVDHYKLKNGAIGYDCIVPVSGGKDSTY